ncbi:MAG TPA: DinB family protein [Vicinamibacterales bacterium]|nr:DinB family protein [Vicinamibacterales bacterium]
MTFDLAHGIAVLERTPATLTAMLSGLPDEWIRNNEGPDTWSPFDIVGHLIDGEMTDWMTRLRVIVDQGANRTFEPFDRFRHKERNKDRTLSELLVEFRDLREKNLRDLRALRLTPDHLRLTGEHPSFGTVTLEQLLATWVVHDLNHIAQISRVMAKQYKQEVGPWHEYLPLLWRSR